MIFSNMLCKFIAQPFGVKHNPKKCAAFWSIFEARPMPSLRLSLLVPILLLALAACTNHSYTSGKEEIPKEASWIYPVYSHLFALATFEGDTFLLLKDPADT